MSPFWKELLSQLLNTLIIIATPVVLMLAHRLIRILEKKWGVDIDKVQEQKIDDYIIQGIAYAQEQGRKALKQQEPVPDKKALAVRYVFDAMSNTGVTKLSEDFVASRIEARLNQTRQYETKEPTP